MIEQKVDPTNPKGSCQRLLEEFGTSLNGARGRVWVGSRGMLETFEVAKEELRKRLEGGKLGKELGKISVELSKVRRVVPVLSSSVRFALKLVFTFSLHFFDLQL